MATIWDKDDVGSLAKALRHRNRFVRRHAAGMLSELGSDAARAVGDLGTAASDKDPEIAVRAARALGRIGAAAVEQLIRALEHPAAAVRREVVWALKAMGPAALPALPALVVALNDPDLPVHLGAAQALGAMGPDATDAIPALAETLRKSNLILCRLAAQALGRIGPAALAVLTEMQESPDRHVRREVAWAVKQIEGGAADDGASGAAENAVNDSTTQRVVELPSAAPDRTVKMSLSEAGRRAAAG